MSVQRISESVFKITKTGSVVGTLTDDIYIGTKSKLYVWAATSGAAGVQQLDVKVNIVQPEAATPPAAGEKVQIGTNVTVIGNSSDRQEYGENLSQFLTNRIEIEQIRTVVGTMDYEIWMEVRD